MKKIKCTIIGIICFLIGFAFCACGTNESYAEQSSPIKIWGQNENGAYETLKVVDDSTGVNYVVVATEVGNGNRSIAITPRLNADGSLYVTGY